MQKTESRKSSFPHAFVILFTVILIAAVATWVVPAGEYSRHVDPASRRTVIDAASFQYVDPAPVNPFQMFVALQKGMIGAADIIFFIFAVFSAIYVVVSTGAIDAAIAWMVRKTRDKPASVNIVFGVLMSVLMIWSSTGTLATSEIVAFVPIFCSLAIALGYDAIVGMAISFVAVGIGFASATANPFTIGVAQSIAELPLFSGIWYRALVIVVIGGITIAWTLRYAAIIKKDPSKSHVADIDVGDFTFDESKVNLQFTNRHRAAFGIFLAAVLVSAYGLLRLDWYINELSAVFIIMGVLVGFADSKRPSQIAELFVEGMRRGVLSAMVVGVARAILIVLSEGKVVDTIIHHSAELLGRGTLYVGSVGMLVFQTLMNFFIPSGSGQAAATMPIMTPLGDLIGMNRQITVLAYQFGDGFSNLLWPTGFLLIACVMARVPLSRYFRWFLPLFAILFVVQVLFLWGAVAMNYGPF